MNELKSYIIEGQVVHPYYDLGLLYHDKRKYRQAISFYKKEIALSGYWKARYNLGLILAERKRYSQAIKQFNIALRKRPLLWEAHNELGNIYFQRGQPNIAITQYLAALSIQKVPFLFHNIGRAYTEAGARTKGIMAFEKAIALAPRYAEPYWQLGAILMEKKATLRKGMNLLRKAKRLSPKTMEFKSEKMARKDKSVQEPLSL